MTKFLFIIILALFSIKSFSQGKGRTIYKYKKFQEFDMETLGVSGDFGSPEDISTRSRFQRDFKNRLPLRKNFNPELKRSVELVR